MAWKASGVWNKPINLSPNKNRDDSSFPGLKPRSPEATSKIEYDELQQNELIALEAIYGDDFVKHAETQSAWKRSEPSFDIRIRASSDEDFAVTLGVVMTATYPKSPPLLTLKDADDLRDVVLFKLQKYLEIQPKVFATEEQEMVDRIVEGIRDILEDAAQAKAKGRELPSLEEERAAHEAFLAKLAQEQKEEEERKREEENKEEERVLGGLLEVELKRQRQKAKESRQKNRNGNGVPAINAMSGFNGTETGRIIFDQPCHTTDKTGNIISFQAVFGKSEVAKGPVSTVFSVWPIVASGQDCPNLALKETTLRATTKDITVFKKQIQCLESNLEAFKKVRHRNLLEVLDFRVQQEKNNNEKSTSSLWTVNILTPSAEKGSLAELLDLAGHLDTSKVRAWTRDLLDALNFLHNKTLVHQDIHPGNVLLFREQTGEVVPKLADSGYQRELHIISSKGQAVSGLSSAKSAYWLPPETAALSKPHYTAKTDLWDFGIVFLQMIFGLDVPQKYHSPSSVSDSMSLSKPLQELVTRFFKPDPKKRPRAFELGSSEFLATDAPVVVEESTALMPSYRSLHSMSPMPRLRRESTNRFLTSSRYREDFDEEGRLGKGGFGEVVKARKKLDGQIYAIKKISQRSQASLTEILKEVRLLSQLSHPAVVRYYNTWVEEIVEQSDTEGDTSTEDLNTEDSRDTISHDPVIHFATSTGGLDFMSSSGYPQVEFGYDDSEAEDDSEEDDEEDEDDSDEETGSEDEDSQGAVGHIQRQARARSQRPFRTVLYISMEYCEKRTLRDLITRKLYQNTPEIWRLFRQVLEGLAHIHGLSIVHRDLKPENIFIAHSSDGTDNVKIGDFGLATSGQFAVDKSLPNAMESDDITRSIGTTFYAAPEVRSASHGMYSSKVDMYSLGIIFFEMCYPPMLGMQRAVVLEQLRRPIPQLPSDFRPAEKVQTDIVQSLLTHNPKERPSSAELLQSGKLPVQMESETIRRTLAGLADPSSPYYKKMLSTLFSRPVEQAKDYAWDMNETIPGQADLLNQGIVKEALVAIFRRHGALEYQRNCLYPRSSHYADSVVRLLDSNGTVLQLPFDLTLGHARMLAKAGGSMSVQRTFTFGNIFRDRQDTGQPLMLGEVDFDIVTTDTLDLALKEAEVLKVLDEIIATFPSLSSSQMCFHLGHSDLLNIIFDYCRVEPGCRRAAADALSRLNIHTMTWQKMRAVLRSPLVGLSATSVDELQRFDFRDSVSKASSKLKSLFEGTDLYRRASSTLAHLKEVAEYAKRLGVASKIYITPLNSLKESFYTGGILFSCLYDKKMKDVFAAGGRYDSLIRENRPRVGGHYEERHAVGFNLSWEKLSRVPKTGGKAFLKKSEEEGHNLFSNTRRCDALVASFDAALLRSTGIEILQNLWANGVSAELARDSRSPEDLLARNRDEGYSWIIVIKQDSIKVKTMDKKDTPDVDLPMAQLMSWLRAEIRERDSKAVAKFRATTQQIEGGAAAEGHQEQDVKVLVAQTRSKKFNRRTVLEQAQASAASLVHSFLDGPILAVETTDQVMDMIRETYLSDGESWRRVEHSVTTTEKKYVREIHDQLLTWKWSWEKKNGSRHSFLYNFRTGSCVYYDLGA
ncbi:hypothetical protein CSOJ01_01190 [Colletotrichum sojae]|uniref:non-specific serine/threonine protein kinase n=1 Tax=Colletotrichum sojae TaxID=2175907 RepID=A0A8H6N4Y2_9PEZI|nr:hypothetical protein CSOJ01_01190 [Colletotrichum sojae]